MTRRILCVLSVVLLVLSCVPALSGPLPTPEETADKETKKPAFGFAEDMERLMLEEIDRVGEQLEAEARSLFERTPLGFDFSTIDRLQRWGVSLPVKLPSLILHVREQSRLLGFVGSLIMLAFLVAIIYSLIGQDKVLRRLEETVAPLRNQIPEFAYPYFLSGLKVVVASLIPLLLYASYGLVSAATAYPASWFRLIGSLLKLWVLAALIINLLRESLTRDLFPIPSSHGKSIFRVARLIVLYIIGCVAVLWGAEAFQIPEDFLALLKFLISLSIVFVSLLFLLKKKALLELLPDLPYNSYEVFVRGLDRFYFPAIFLTFLTGLLWCVGFHALCTAIWTKTWAVAGSFLLIMVTYHLLQGWLGKWMEKKGATDPKVQPLYRAIRTLLLYATVTTILAVTLDLLGLLVYIQRVLSFPLALVGESQLSIWTLIKAILIILGFLFASRLLRAFLDYKIYPSIGFDEGLAYAINMFLNYFFLIVGCLFAMRAVGLDLRVLLIFAGALGIGIGLGLQNTAANLISGFSIVFGQRIRKGDWIQVEDTVGCVEEVSLRCTKVRTRDNIEYLVPNADLTSKMIVNYSLADPQIRLHVPVGVSYSASPREVEQILLRAAEENPLVSKKPAPEVRFSEYGDNSLNFELFAWMDIRECARDKVKSTLYFAIFDGLDAANIEIPFPQRDIHIRSGLHLSEKG